MAPADQPTRDALALLADLARGDSGGSYGARSMLIYAWDTSRPIYEFASLSGRHRAAAVVILDRVWSIPAEEIESIVPEVIAWHKSQQPAA